MKKERLLIVVPSLGTGGMERYATNISNALTGQNIEVSIFLLLINKVSFDLNPKIKIYRPLNTKYYLLKPIYILVQLFRLRKLIAKEKFNYVFSISGMHSPYVLLSSIFLKTNTYASDRSSPLIRYSKVTELLKKLLYPRANAIICQTSFSKQIYYNRFKANNTVVIPNPIRDIKQYDLNKKNQVITVSRLIKSKRVDTLIKIFSSIENIKDWELVIVGDGPEYESLKKLVSTQKLQNRISFIGETNNVDYFLAQAKIFAFTSASEGFPNSLCEAMESGLACISFDCVAGPSDIIIDQHNGILIKDNDIDDYISKLSLLINDNDLREYLIKNSKKVTEKLKIDFIANKLINTFRDYARY